jgi:hypothetical protein
VTKATIHLILRDAFIAEFVLSASVLAVMAYRRLLRTFPFLGAYLALQVIDLGISTPLLFFRKQLHLSTVRAYDVYLWWYWPSYALQAILLVLIIQHVFSIAMKPLEGLHQLGKIIFRWIVAVSVVLSACEASGSAMSWGHSVNQAAAVIASQVQEGICVLTLCLLLFVCFAARPLGLTPRSHIFGVSLGLGFIATSNLVMAACLTHINANNSLYSPLQLIYIGGSIVCFSIWGTYFALPEPERKMILLPTTSPFFFWNKVSEALGDDPGHVAVAGFRPDMLADGEITMLTAMSKAARERDEQQAHAAAAINHMGELQAAGR